VVQAHEPVGMLHHPFGVDPGVVGHHVHRQPDAAVPGPVPQGIVGLVPPQFRGDGVIVQGVGRGHGLGVAAKALDLQGGRASLPDAYQPQGIEAAFRQLGQLRIRYLVQPVYLITVLLGELPQPDHDVLGHHHRVGHPVEVGRVLAGLVARAARVPLGHHLPKVGHGRRAGTEVPLLGLLADGVQGHQNAAHQPLQHLGGYKLGPVLPDIAQLFGYGSRCVPGRRLQQVEQCLAVGAEARLGLEELFQPPDGRKVLGAVGQAGVVEKLGEFLEGRVAVGKPQVQQLLGRDRQVRIAFHGPGKVAGRVHLPLVDRQRREIAGEGEHQLAEGLFADLRLDLVGGLLERFGVLLPPVALGHDVQYLVQQSHGRQLGRADRRPGSSLVRPGPVDPLGQGLGLGDVDQHRAAAVGEQQLIDPVLGPAGLRDVELEDRGKIMLMGERAHV